MSTYKQNSMFTILQLSMAHLAQLLSLLIIYG